MMDFPNKNKAISFVRNKYIISFFKKYYIHYVLGFISLFIVDLLQAKIPIIAGTAIDIIDAGIKNINQISNYALNMIIIGFVVYIGKILWRYFIMGTSRIIEKDIRNDLFEHLEKLSSSFFQKHKTGELMAYMTNDLEAIRMALGPGILFICDIILMLSLTLYNMIININLSLTLISIIPLISIAITTSVMGGKLHRRFSDKQQAYAELSDFVQEYLSGIKVVKSFVQENNEINFFEKVNKNSYNKNTNLMKIQSFMNPFMQLVSGLSLAIAMGYGGYLTIKNMISVGDFVAFIQYLGMLVWPMIAIGMAINVFIMGAASLQRIESILYEYIEIKDDKNVKNIKSFEGSIKVENLNFKYPKNNKYALQNISFELDKGETLGIIGRTGSGKTTLVELFLRIYNIDKNMIFLGGYDVTEIPLNILRKNIGYVPQDNFLFSDTISNNIDFALRNSSVEKIIEAAKGACVHDNIIEFQDGYNTMIGERGVSLSGGQKQRVSIARALIKSPQILILDDSVSAVDTDTEEKILKYLSEGRKDKTNIIIAHRISTIQNADKIIVLEDGKIVEIGKHEELLKLKGVYNSIYEKQLLEKILEES